MTAEQLEQLRHEMAEDFAWAMEHDAMLEARLACLEEVAAARWPRRWLLAARLRRQLRASVAGYAWAGPAWTDMRNQAASDEMIAGPAGEDLGDGTEPYCTVCGAAAGLFQGVEGWQHYRGEGTVASPVELYDPGHKPVIGWRPEGGQR